MHSRHFSFYKCSMPLKIYSTTVLSALVIQNDAFRMHSIIRRGIVSDTFLYFENRRFGFVRTRTHEINRIVAKI